MTNKIRTIFLGGVAHKHARGDVVPLPIECIIKDMPDYKYEVSVKDVWPTT